MCAKTCALATCTYLLSIARPGKFRTLLVRRLQAVGRPAWCENLCQVPKIGVFSLEGPLSELMEEEEEEEKEEEEEETLCRNAGLAHSLELNPESEVLNCSRIDTSLPTTLHLASPRIRIQINS